MKNSIYIASDHAGFPLKKEILKIQNIGFVDLGTNNLESVDYPDYASKLVKKMSKESNSRGILICGSGIGMSIVANRHKNIRAALCHNLKSARLSREHNNSNVIAIGSRLIKKNIALKCVNTFLNTKFQGGRHQRRVKKI